MYLNVKIVKISCLKVHQYLFSRFYCYTINDVQLAIPLSWSTKLTILCKERTTFPYSSWKAICYSIRPAGGRAVGRRVVVHPRMCVCVCVLFSFCPQCLCIEIVLCYNSVIVVMVVIRNINIQMHLNKMARWTRPE